MREEGEEEGHSVLDFGFPLYLQWLMLLFNNDDDQFFLPLLKALKADIHEPLQAYFSQMQASITSFRQRTQLPVPVNLLYPATIDAYDLLFHFFGTNEVLGYWPKIQKSRCTERIQFVLFSRVHALADFDRTKQAFSLSPASFTLFERLVLSFFETHSDAWVEFCLQESTATTSSSTLVVEEQDKEVAALLVAYFDMLGHLDQTASLKQDLVLMAAWGKLKEETRLDQEQRKRWRAQGALQGVLERWLGTLNER